MLFWHSFPRRLLSKSLVGARLAADVKQSTNRFRFHRQATCCPPESTVSDVIVVGAGPAGLTLASLLSRFDVSVTVLEKQRGLTAHPQAHFINHRSMEVFRGLDGLAARIVAASPPLDHWRKFIYCETVSGRVLGEVDHFARQNSALQADLSPEPVTHFSQHRLVPLLYDTAVRGGARFLFDTQVVGLWDRGGCGVELTLAKDQGGLELKRATLECKYVVLCDGANSLLRGQLGISMVGNPAIQHLINVHFKSKSLAFTMRANPGMLYFVLNTDAVLVVVVHCLESGEFVAQIPYFPPLQRPSEFDARKCKQLINLGAGCNLRDLDILEIRPWTMRAQVADRFSLGRAFLVGDSAHVFPPAGGFGMNTGIQDAHNLAWKLAVVLKGDSSKGILATYEKERKPIAMANAELSVRNWNEASRVPSIVGLNPDHANMLNKISSEFVGWALPETTARSFLEIGLKGGRLLSGLRGPLKTAREKALRELFKSGETLRLQFPREDLGFGYSSLNHAGVARCPTKAAGLDRNVPFEPFLQVGYRLPHCFFEWLPCKGKTPTKNGLISSLDLVSMVHYRFILFSPIGATWASHLPIGLSRCQLLMVSVTAASMRPYESSPVNHYVPGSELAARDSEIMDGGDVDVLDYSGKWERLTQKRSVLVRPDGHVVWVGFDQGGHSVEQMISCFKRVAHV